MNVPGLACWRVGSVWTRVRWSLAVPAMAQHRSAESQPANPSHVNTPSQDQKNLSSDQHCELNSCLLLEATESWALCYMVLW